MEEAVGPFHVPQHTRRLKLRFLPPNFPPSTTTGLNLSLSSATSSTVCGGGGVYGAAPLGPFTGYAAILGRSRFLRPAQELLDDLCQGNRNESGDNCYSSDFDKAAKLLEDSGTWFGEGEYGGDQEQVSRRCNNPTLLSMLTEVYKRYKLYCQQMHSAVTSFESVAGLGNASPFICLAIKAMFRHFHCLKNAILDHIRISGKVLSSSVGFRKGCSSGSCSEDKGYFQQKHVPDLVFAQHPVWRSQRGFPDRAVAVLKTWLYEHFLHPYPSDSDKQMLAQKTGLSRSQVSNWFTNARVRLWKPMVEEMHALERKTQCSRTEDTQPLMCMTTGSHNVSMPTHPSQSFLYRDQQDSNCKRSRIEHFSMGDINKEQCLTTPYSNNLSNKVMILNGTQTEEHPSAAATALSWTTTTTGQMIPFWLAKQ